MSAADVVAFLNLAPHPEGGHYRETFRDPHESGGRAASTAIYFLLPAGVTSRWHRVDAAEVWHWYAGHALELTTEHNGRAQSIILGNRLLDGQRPQAIVEAGQWQRARSLGIWTLVGCTVAPGFTFNGFDIAPATFDPPAA
ncbi:MAG: cupin domain-containing protein [Hyphomicrobiaceae bacterium]|nr:cupin domain-containing protein [Hyphomicrobiaceae bacterium]